MHLAIAKIRKVTDPLWHPWDGWVPSRGVIATRIADHEMLRHCVPASGSPIGLGRTLTGEPFQVERTALGTVNLIVGATALGASHLAQVLMSELIDQGGQCVVFDTTGTHALPSIDHETPLGGLPGRRLVIHLVVGESLKLGVLHSGLDALSAMLRQFGLPRAPSMFFESHVMRRLGRIDVPADANHPAPFIGIDDLIQLAQSLEAEGHAVVGGAILSCLDAIRKTQILAVRPAEATAFWDGLAQIRQGGALVIDLSRLPRPAQTSVIFSLVGSLKGIAERDSAMPSTHARLMFFDDMQPLVSSPGIVEELIGGRASGLTSVFVTTRVGSLARNLLPRVDNLFLRHLKADYEVRHLANSGFADVDTLRGLGRGLGTHHGLVIGRATGGYPMIFVVNPPGGAEPTAEASAFERRPTAPRMAPSGQARRPSTTRLQVSIETGRNLPLFPEEAAVHLVASERCDGGDIGGSWQPPTPSLAQVTALWDHIVTRVARRRRILETILAVVRPLRIAGQELVLGFPPQHRFQMELIASAEYRSLLEEELHEAFGVSLTVTTEVDVAAPL